MTELDESRDDAKDLSESPIAAPPAAPPPAPASGSRVAAVLLWVLAVVLTLSALVYQRATGPTHPRKGTLEVAGQSARYGLLRSHETTAGAPIRLPALDGLQATLNWRRLIPDEPEPFQALPMTPQTVEEHGEQVSVLQAVLPAQPAAGKLEYYVEVETPEGTRRIPEAKGATDPKSADDEYIVLRYKDPVPNGVLIPHIFLIFFAMLFGVRSGVAALFGIRTCRRDAWVALTLMTLGGMVFGPMVQKHAFGAYWTGFPWGYDLTDNKMLIMWLAWVVACSTVGLRAKPREGVGRAVVLLAALIMIGVYLIPHSLRGSQLDYKKLDEVEHPHDAIGTGK